MPNFVQIRSKLWPCIRNKKQTDTHNWFYVQGGPTKVVPSVTSKNVSWYHFSWATLYIGLSEYLQRPEAVVWHVALRRDDEKSVAPLLDDQVSYNSKRPLNSFPPNISPQTQTECRFIRMLYMLTFEVYLFILHRDQIVHYRVCIFLVFARSLPTLH